MTATPYQVPGPWSGTLAVVQPPRGGSWLDADVRDLRAVGVEVLVSMLSEREVEVLDLADEGAACERLGVEFLAFPFEDQGVPASVGATVALAQDIAVRLFRGQSVGLHCRWGLGRSALIAAVVLANTGLDLSAAFEAIERARGLGFPAAWDQRKWAEQFATELAAPHAMAT